MMMVASTGIKRPMINAAYETVSRNKTARNHRACHKKNRPVVDTDSDSDADSTGSLDFTDFVNMFASDAPAPPPVAPPRQPAPAAMPTYTRPEPPVTTDAPFSRLMRSATTLGLPDVVSKFTRASVNFATIDKGFDPDTLSLQEVITYVKLTEDELVALSQDISSAAPYPRSNTTISSNGVPIKHHHASMYSSRSGPSQGVLIRTNAGTIRTLRV